MSRIAYHQSMNAETNRNSFDLWSRTLAEWNAAHGAAFAVNEAFLRWNLERQSLVKYEVCEIAGVPVVYAVASDAGIAAGLVPTTLWISLWGHINTSREIEFVHGVKAFARELGKTRILFGADEFHLVSGVPLSSSGGERLIQALNASGFKGMEVADYVGDLASAATERYIADAHALAAGRGLRFEVAESFAELDALDGFLSTEFPGRWTREFRFWRASREEAARAFWMSLADESGLIGFARMAVRGRVSPLDQAWTPGALRLPFATGAKLEPHDSCLGPIGVAASQRGRGTGKILLGLVLETLRANEAERVCIDWTNAFKYYEPLKYERVRQIWTAWFEG